MKMLSLIIISIFVLFLLVPSAFADWEIVTLDTTAAFNDDDWDQTGTPDFYENGSVLINDNELLEIDDSLLTAFNSESYYCILGGIITTASNGQYMISDGYMDGGQQWSYADANDWGLGDQDVFWANSPSVVRTDVIYDENEEFYMNFTYNHTSGDFYVTRLEDMTGESLQARIASTTDFLGFGEVGASASNTFWIFNLTCWNISADFYVEKFYNLTIINPTTSNPESVTDPQNITINFTIEDDEGNYVTSGVTMDNITIGGEWCNISYNSYFGDIQIDYSSFESGLDGWSDCGADCNIDATIYSCDTHSMRLADDDNAGITKAMDYSGYSSVNVTFKMYQSSGVDSGECIELYCDATLIGEYGGGVTTCATDIGSEGQWEDVVDVIDSGDCDFMTNPVITFVSTSTLSSEYFYLDCIEFSSEANLIYKEFGYSDDGWMVNCTIPCCDSGGIAFTGLQDLFLNATYSLNDKTYNETQLNAVSYGVSDSCSCPASGDWNIDCSDNCVISSDCNMKTNDVHTYGSGNLYLKATISNYGAFYNRCDLFCYDAVCFG